MKTFNLNILIVEDDHLTLVTNKRILRDYGNVFTASNIEEAQKHLNSGTMNVAFIDLNLNGELKGLEIIKLASQVKTYPIVVSGESEETILREAFLNGANDFLLKPFSIEKLEQALRPLRNTLNRPKYENIIKEKYITSSSRQIEELLKLGKIADSDKPIFFLGETGTGKKVVSSIVKELSHNTSFVEVNCSQFTDELLASELFGHKKGAFTGANENKVGLLEVANNGIIFLDEIHSLSPKSQKILLKALEEKVFYPVGSHTPIRSNFRILSATCEDIHGLIKNGQFREDLFARISTFQINLLPLRERKEDILFQLEYFISKQLIRVFIEDDAKEALLNYSWPRNTREIQDLVENWVVDGNRLITLEGLPSHIRNQKAEFKDVIEEKHLEMIEKHGLNPFLTHIKKEATLRMIKRHKGVLKNAAEVMNVSYTSLSSFLKSHKTLEHTGLAK